MIYHAWSTIRRAIELCNSGDIVIMRSGKYQAGMMEEIISPENYTPEIKAAISTINRRMQNSLIDFSEQDIKVVRYNKSIYILANPILGEEPIFDESGNFLTMIPMRNITMIYDDNWLKTEMDNEKLKFTAKIPRVRILRPDLCDRIDAGD